MLNLPDDMIKNIAEFVCIVDRISMKFTCKRFNKIINNLDLTPFISERIKGVFDIDYFMELLGDKIVISRNFLLECLYDEKIFGGIDLVVEYERNEIKEILDNDFEILRELDNLDIYCKIGKIRCSIEYTKNIPQYIYNNKIFSLECNYYNGELHISDWNSLIYRKSIIYPNKYIIDDILFDYINLLYKTTLYNRKCEDFKEFIKSKIKSYTEDFINMNLQWEFCDNYNQILFDYIRDKIAIIKPPNKLIKNFYTELKKLIEEEVIFTTWKDLYC